MSAQGATVRRETTHLPVWPLAILVAATAAIVFAISLYNVRPETQAPARTVTDQERFANSSAAIREQGAAFPEVSPVPVTSNPGQWTYANAKAYVDGLATGPAGAGISQVTEKSSGTVVRPGWITADTLCGQCR